VGELFVNPGDVILSPDKLWGNYRLTFETRLKGKVETFSLFDEAGGFNLKALEAKLQELAEDRKKIILLLNFPNNPTGYTPKPAEADGIVAIVKAQAEKGTQILTISDDSYFGLFFEDSIKESLFGKLCDLHENVLAVKLDGATKEYYAWGFRTGFISFGSACADKARLYAALEKKAMGAIRGSISNCNHVSQTVVEKLFAEPDFQADWQEKFLLMKGRALKVKEVLNSAPYKEELAYYPFNSGYFMCLRLEDVDAEQLRLHLLDKYGVGAISIGATDLRVAFSCIEEEDVEELFSLILQGVRDLRK